MTTTRPEQVTGVWINHALIEHLDEDWDQPCEGHGDGCPVSAVWVAWVGVCCETAESTWLWCQRHLDIALGLRNLTCHHCGAGVFPHGRDVIRLIEPLNRRPQ